MELEIFFDYACPFCYAGLYHLYTLLPDYPELTLLWRTVEAHPAPEPPMEIDFATERWWKNQLPVYLGLPFVVGVPPSPTPRSNLALAGLLYLLNQNLPYESYHKAVYHALFHEQRDISQIAVLQSCAKETGVDAEVFAQAIGSEAYQKRVREANRYAYEQVGVEFVPTFRIGTHRLNVVGSRGVTREALANFLDTHATVRPA